MDAPGPPSLIVTLRTLTEAAATGMAEGGPAPPPEEVQRYGAVLARLARETAASGPGVLVAVGDRDVCLVQSAVAAQAEAGAGLPGGATEAKFGDGATGGDIWGWFRSLFDHIGKQGWHPIVRPASGPGTLAEAGRIAVVSDWGTNLYGAPVSAASIARRGGYEMVLHLGDIYYSGTPSEVRERFLDAWPTGAGTVSRALNGNHEMYSGGFGYFDGVLPAFGQEASYFAVQNTHWLLAGLDTAHTDHDLDGAQVDWLTGLAEAAGSRRLVLFSHHQPFSRLDRQGPRLQAALAGLLASGRIAAWYWGHEHDCVVYDRHAGFGLLGRCIGNGGVPSPRKDAVKAAPAEANGNGIAWKRLAATADAPACLVLDGPNPLVPGEEEKFGPHGFLTLEFDGPRLTERLHLPDGTEIFRGEVS